MLRKGTTTPDTAQVSRVARLATLIALTLMLLSPVSPAMASQPASFFVPLTGAEVVAGPGDPDEGGDPDGSGDAIIVIDVKGGTLCFNIELQNISDPIFGGTLHTGFAGETGAVAVRLFSFAEEGQRHFGGCRFVDEAVLKDIVKEPEFYYIRITNQEFEANGALRGQLPGIEQ